VRICNLLRCRLDSVVYPRATALLALNPSAGILKSISINGTGEPYRPYQVKAGDVVLQSAKSEESTAHYFKLLSCVT
jgi:hypothetical protein